MDKSIDIGSAVINGAVTGAVNAFAAGLAARLGWGLSKDFEMSDFLRKLDEAACFRGRVVAALGADPSESDDALVSRTTVAVASCVDADGYDTEVVLTLREANRALRDAKLNCEELEIDESMIGVANWPDHSSSLEDVYEALSNDPEIEVQEGALCVDDIIEEIDVAKRAVLSALKAITGSVD